MTKSGLLVEPADDRGALRRMGRGLAGATWVEGRLQAAFRRLANVRREEVKA